MSLFANPRLREVAKQRCRELRKNQTNAEAIFWETVRDRKFSGLKFYRQHPLFFDDLGKETFFIADFFCHEQQLVVEIDGKIHDDQQERDQQRTAIINLMNIDVVRFRNEEIENDLGNVLAKLRKIINEKNRNATELTPQHPLLGREGEGVG